LARARKTTRSNAVPAAAPSVFARFPWRAAREDARSTRARFAVTRRRDGRGVRSANVALDLKSNQRQLEPRIGRVLIKILRGREQRD
jgi:hypothetical protein